MLIKINNLNQRSVNRKNVHLNALILNAVFTIRCFAVNAILRILFNTEDYNIPFTATNLCTSVQVKKVSIF